MLRPSLVEVNIDTAIFISTWSVFEIGHHNRPFVRKACGGREINLAEAGELRLTEALPISCESLAIGCEGILGEPMPLVLASLLANLNG
jgi:hypothetical protein